MKKYLIILLFALALLVSCADEDEGGISTSSGSGSSNASTATWDSAVWDSSVWGD